MSKKSLPATAAILKTRKASLRLRRQSCATNTSCAIRITWRRFPIDGRDYHDEPL
ncbi:hypothetical protein [Petralouisia muris]|uniref:hypothetical protein n=1 Tax=Petralouisia muris TaxID=3032872 RepID=UPI001440F337|nr:hypothetical protein [Petralouisia muris]